MLVKLLHKFICIKLTVRYSNLVLIAEFRLEDLPVDSFFWTFELIVDLLVSLASSDCGVQKIFYEFYELLLERLSYLNWVLVIARVLISYCWLGIHLRAFLNGLCISWGWTVRTRRISWSGIHLWAFLIALCISWACTLRSRRINWSGIHLWAFLNAFCISWGCTVRTRRISWQDWLNDMIIDYWKLS